jgi:hypothetical protein
MNVEIIDIKNDGFWISVQGIRYFISFENYPGFKQASAAQIMDFNFDENEIHWSELDEDIEIEALIHPENYPLIFRKKY